MTGQRPQRVAPDTRDQRRGGGPDGWSKDPKTGLWTFDTRSVARTGGFDLWRDFNDRAGTPTGLKPIGDLGPRARISIAGSPSFSSSDIAATPHVITRTASDVRRGVEGLVLVILVVTGTSVAEQHDRTVVVSPGEIVLLFMDAPFTLAHTTGGAFRGSRVPASDFPPGLPDRTPLLLSPRVSPLAELAANLLRWHPSDQDVLSSFGDLIREQLVALLTRGLDMPSWRAEPDRHLADAVKSVIEAEIGNPMLSAKLLCARLGVSRTSLFEALAEDGNTLGNLIRERRLIGCRTDILRAKSTETLAAISERWGFRDQSTFTRAFSRRFGQPPTRWSRTMQKISDN